MINIIDIQKEFTFETSRSGGKGGQNVNKVESKVSLVWDFETSPMVSFEEKEKIYLKANSYLCAEGIRVTSQKSRSQLDNKQNTIDKLDVLLKEWFKIVKKRKPTKRPYSITRKRLKNKKVNSDIKKSRGKPGLEN
jgi:ribosome-associated protein